MNTRRTALRRSLVGVAALTALAATPAAAEVGTLGHKQNVDVSLGCDIQVQLYWVESNDHVVGKPDGMEYRISNGVLPCRQRVRSIQLDFYQRGGISRGTFRFDANPDMNIRFAPPMRNRFTWATLSGSYVHVIPWSGSGTSGSRIGDTVYAWR